MNSDLFFRVASLGDIDNVMEIVRGAQERLRILGTDQWQNGYHNRERIEADVALGYGRVLTRGEEVVAYGALIYDGEAAYDNLTGGKWLTSLGAYLTIHRLCVAGSAVGRGVGREFMLRAELEAAPKVASVRVDTHPGNCIMQGLVGSLGYTRCGEVVYESPRLAYEKLLR